MYFSVYRIEYYWVLHFDVYVVFFPCFSVLNKVHLPTLNTSILYKCHKRRHFVNQRLGKLHICQSVLLIFLFIRYLLKPRTDHLFGCANMNVQKICELAVLPTMSRSTAGLRPSKLFTYTNLVLHNPADNMLLLCWYLNEVHLRFVPANIRMTSI